MTVVRPKIVQSRTTTLAAPITSTEVAEIVLTKLIDAYGNAILLASFWTTIYLTLEPGSDNEEIISFTGFTRNDDNTVSIDTGIVRGISAVYPYSTAGTPRNHAAGSVAIISNNPSVYESILAYVDDHFIQTSPTILGKYTFPSDANRPTLASDVDSATSTDLVTVGQLSRQAISGAANASSSVKGIVQLATQAQVDAKTTTGSTGASLVPSQDQVRSTLLSDYKPDTGVADAYVITPAPTVSAYTTGQIFTFKAAHTNTTTATLNVSSLGAKTIKKADGATNLAAGDIVTGQIIIVEYDGTNFQMLNPVATPPVTASVLASAVKFGGNGSDGALLVTSGSTVIDLGNAAVFIKNYTSISITGTGAVSFINPNTNGTLLILRSQGNVTLTSSATPMLDFSGLGGAGGTGGTSGATGSSAPGGSTGNFILGGASAGGGGQGNTSDLSSPSSNAAGSAGAALTASDVSFQYGITLTAYQVGRAMRLACGSGGGGGGFGSVNGGAGGNGGGAALIECGGAWNFTTSSGIDISGKNGTVGSSVAGSGGGGGGGGGGSVGMLLVLYNTLTSNSGTIIANSGAGGNSGTTTATAGGHGPNGGGGGGGGGAFGAGSVGGAGSNAGGAGNNGGGGSNGGGGGGGGGNGFEISGTKTGGASSTYAGAALITQNLFAA